MALIIEDGTLPENANSYVSYEAADAYLSVRNLWEPAPADGAEDPLANKKEFAIIRAFDALNVLSWVGEPLDWQRIPAFPRLNVLQYPQPADAKKPVYIEPDVVPNCVKTAQIELAGLIYGGLDPLAPVEHGGVVISKSESSSEGSVDVIGGDSKSSSVTYSDKAPVETYLPAVYGLIKPYLKTVPGKMIGIAVGKALRG